MTSSTTAMLSVSPKHVGAWGDTNLWRIAGTAQLVENSIPYWLVTPTQPEAHLVRQESVTVDTPHAETVVQSVLILLATWFGGQASENLLVETHNLTVDEGIREMAPYWELAGTTQRNLAKQLSSQVRLGITIFEQNSLLGTSAINLLRDLGFDITVFTAGSTVLHR